MVQYEVLIQWKVKESPEMVPQSKHVHILVLHYNIYSLHYVTVPLEEWYVTEAL